MTRLACFLLVLVLCLELALWEAFLVASRPFGLALPLAAVLAVAGNLAVGLAGARVLGSPIGAAVPGVLWLGLALVLGTRTAEGDVIVTNTMRGTAFLLAGTAAAAAAVGLSSSSRKAGPASATPSGESRR